MHTHRYNIAVMCNQFLLCDVLGYATEIPKVLGTVSKCPRLGRHKPFTSMSHTCHKGNVRLWEIPKNLGTVSKCPRMGHHKSFTHKRFTYITCHMATLWEMLWEVICNSISQCWTHIARAGIINQNSNTDDITAMAAAPQAVVVPD